jgi:IS30 family transposase
MAHTELDLRERRTIEDMLNARMSFDKIAAKIGRHRSTVFRDIKRNRFIDAELPALNGYYGKNALKSAVERRARHRKFVRFVDLCRHAELFIERRSGECGTTPSLRKIPRQGQRLFERPLGVRTNRQSGFFLFLQNRF